MAGVKGMRPMAKPIKRLSEFQPLFGKWFGELRLLSVEYSRHGEKSINMVVCRVVCVAGHESRVRWHRLRRHGSSQCDTCRSIVIREAPIPTQAKPNAITNGVAELEPIRRELFYALVKSRRGVTLPEDTEMEYIINDCLIYAKTTTQPQRDLDELHEPIGDTRAAYSQTGWVWKKHGESPKP